MTLAVHAEKTEMPKQRMHRKLFTKISETDTRAFGF